MIKGLFLDRDGIINKDHAYVYKIKDFEFVDGIFSFCKAMQEGEYKIFVVTNQSGIARGFFTETNFLNLTKWMISEFKKEHIKIEDFRYCKELGSSSPCRKPNPGMFLDLIERYNIDPSNSISVGDKETDITAAKKAGIKNNFLIETKYPIPNKTESTKVFKSIKELQKYLSYTFLNKE